MSDKTMTVEAPLLFRCTKPGGNNEWAIATRLDGEWLKERADFEVIDVKDLSAALQAREAEVEELRTALRELRDYGADSYRIDGLAMRERADALLTPHVEPVGINAPNEAGHEEREDCPHSALDNCDCWEDGRRVR